VALIAVVAAVPAQPPVLVTALVSASPALPASPWRAAASLHEHAVIPRSPSKPTSARNRTLNRKERPKAVGQRARFCRTRAGPPVSWPPYTPVHFLWILGDGVRNQSEMLIPSAATASPDNYMRQPLREASHRTGQFNGITPLEMADLA
jgi:hypothetical protein